MLRPKVDGIVTDSSLFVILSLHLAEGFGRVGVLAVDVNVDGNEMGAGVGRSCV